MKVFLFQSVLCRRQNLVHVFCVGEHVRHVTWTTGDYTFPPTMVAFPLLEAVFTAVATMLIILTEDQTIAQ